MHDDYRYYRQRSSRPRSTRREEPEGDTVTAALTIQLLVVILLLLTVWILKQMNEQAFDQFKVTYRDMTEESAGFEAAEAWDQFWRQIESLAHGLPPAQDAESSSSQPELLPEEEESEDAAPAWEFDYDYRHVGNAVYTLGQGGANPIPMQRVDPNTMLAPPQNAVLSPVLLSAPVRPPLTGIVTSRFAWRYHPITDTSDFHTGIDIAAPEGSSILAALPGEVVEVGYSQIYGHYIVLQHATNLQTSYSHCSEIIATEGAAIKQGERIAKVGSTGVATGPHLHFSVIVDGLFTDPLWVLEDHIELVKS